MLEAALRCARSGMIVFPLHWVDDHGQCSCGNPECKSAGKHPLTEHGLKDASRDETVINTWWTRWPKANIGLVTGTPNRIFVLDVDPDKGGLDSLAVLEKQYGPLPETLTARSGGGGWHYYFELAEGQVIKSFAGAKIGPGLDVRSEGGYIVIPPSKTAGLYIWIKTIRCAPLPHWLERLVTAPAPPSQPHSDGQSDSIPEGQRNDRLISLAGTMWHRGFSLEAIKAALLIDNQRRCVPPLSESEVLKIAQSISNYPRTPQNDNQQNYQPRYGPPITVEEVSGVPLTKVTAQEFILSEIKPRPMLLDPVLPAQGLAMLYSKRGIGKTYLALGLAAAVASGGQFLRWRAPQSHHVLYVDGELPAITLQERIASILASIENEFVPEALQFITPDLQQRPMPNLATVQGQALIEPHLAAVHLVVLDNLSALCHCDENEGFDWLPVQNWTLSLRRRGISVLLIHHAGKSGAQRGTSRREDLLDTVITLKHPADYEPSQGLRCQVHFEKTRAMLGDQANPFEVRLETQPNGAAAWTVQGLEHATTEQAEELFETGMSARDVAAELGISRATAFRLRKFWRANRDGADS